MNCMLGKIGTWFRSIVCRTAEWCFRIHHSSGARLDHDTHRTASTNIKWIQQLHMNYENNDGWFYRSNNSESDWRLDIGQTSLTYITLTTSGRGWLRHMCSDIKAHDGAMEYASISYHSEDELRIVYNCKEVPKYLAPAVAVQALGATWSIAHLAGLMGISTT